jgi:hypothetical protein
MLCNTLVEMLLVNHLANALTHGGNDSTHKSMRQVIMSWSCSYSQKASQPASPDIVLCPKAFLLDTEFGQTNKIGALLQIVRLQAWYKQKSLSELHHSKKHNQSKGTAKLSKGTLKKLQNLKVFQKHNNTDSNQSPDSRLQMQS